MAHNGAAEMATMMPTFHRNGGDMTKEMSVMVSSVPV
jgi:hypothetical protein